MRITSGLLVVVFSLVVTELRAEDAAADRAEMDLAAGRVMFQNSPLSERIIEIRPVGSAGIYPAPDQNRRRGIRVVLPSPYERR